MIDNYHQRSHILVTGGAGYIGSRLVGVLLDKGHFVTVVDRLQFGGNSILGFHAHPHFHFLKADVSKGGVVKQAAREGERSGAPPVRALVHLAGTVGFPACQNVGSQEAWKQNTETVKVAHDQAAKIGAERFLFSSTYSAYGLSPNGSEVNESSPLNPQSLYAQTKIAAEEYLLQVSDSPCVPLIFRFATLYGTSPRMRFDLIINQFVLEALHKGELLIYQKDYSRSFVHIQDVIEGILMGLEAPKDKIQGEIYNLGSDRGNLTKEEVVAIIQDALPTTRIRYGDHSFSGDMRDVRVSYSKIRKRLGFQANRTVREGVQEVIHLLQSGLIEDPFDDRFRNARLDIQ